MLEPNPPGKRPEKFMFNFALLWTDDGGEFNIAEARARSMGLLDKRWNPPPASESRLAPGNMPSTSESTGMHTTRTLKRKSIMGGGPEPTMTINTKEALADVFGMYNSPERTMRHAQVAGGKHAPLMKVDITPSIQFEKRIAGELVLGMLARLRELTRGQNCSRYPKRYPHPSDPDKVCIAVAN